MIELKGLVIFLMTVGFAMPAILVTSIFYLKCKFSGVPKRDEYKSRLRKLNWVVALWSLARLIRAISSIWDVNLFFGMMIEMNKPAGADGSAQNKDDLKKE